MAKDMTFLQKLKTLPKPRMHKLKTIAKTKQVHKLDMGTKDRTDGGQKKVTENLLNAKDQTLKLTP